MDPNATLQAMREAWARALDNDDNDEARAEAMADAAEAADSLDQWLSAGGFLPDAWKVAK